VGLEIVDKVNQRLPQEQQFALLGWYWPKYSRLWREYRMLYPDGKLLRRMGIPAVVTIACLMTCAWALGFFGR
jgi:hypothetical protein